MPTARELLDQADALMRRNRAGQVDDIPVLTDVAQVLPEARVLRGRGAQARTPAPLARHPDEADSLIAPDEGDSVGTADEGDSIIAAGEGDSAATAEEEDSIPTVDEGDSIIAAADDDWMPSEEGDSIPTLTERVAPVATAGVDAPGATVVDADGEPSDWLLQPDDDASSAGAVSAPAPSAPSIDVVAMPVPDPLPVAMAAAEAGAPSGSAAELELPAAAMPAAPVPAANQDDAYWQGVAEDVRMQVLQRIDIFTDTGLREQLAARLQPIVDRASADLVATINQHVGDLLRAYVAEAIEREIDSWRRSH